MGSEVAENESSGRRPLLRVVDGPRLAYDRDANLAGILQVFLDPARNLPRQILRSCVVDLGMLDHDAHLAAGLDRIRALDAGERVRDLFQGFEALDVDLQALAPR